MTTQQPPRYDELKRLHKPVINVNVQHKHKLTRLELLAIWITDHVGTMGFFMIIFVWTVGWLGWNALAPKGMKFDPAPAFVLWLFVSNMIQLFLLPLLMIGQNLQSRHSEARAEADFQVNTQSEREIEAILMKLERQEEMQLEILKELKGRG
ncbi:MAG: DUF1003 domain-containing protein [Patescibacteria group bacterium]|jgi:uncharacterized membrane protein